MTTSYTSTDKANNGIDIIVTAILDALGVQTNSDIADLKITAGLIQAAIDSLTSLNWVATHTFSGTGNGSAQAITVEGTKLIICNMGVNTLTITLSGLTFTIPAGVCMPISVAEFSSGSVTATSGDTYCGFSGG